MWWTQAINAGFSLFGASKQRKAAREARIIAGMNADASRAETAETIRRMQRDNEQTESYAKAVAGASGFSVQAGTSQQAYISEMVKENRRQVQFMSEAGRREADIIERGGQLAYREGKARAVSSVASGVSQLAGMWKLGKEQNWKLWG